MYIDLRTTHNPSWTTLNHVKSLAPSRGFCLYIFFILREVQENIKKRLPIY